MREFDSNGCVFKNDCIKYGTVDCKDPCYRQREYYYLLDNSNLPERYKYDTPLYPAKEDIDVFDYLALVRENICDFVNDGASLIIRGATGTGKSTWACKLLRQFIADISIANGYVKQATFMNLPVLITQLRHNISDRNADFEVVRKSLYEVPLVVLDDLGAVALNSDFVHDEIYSIINTRIDNGLATIYTTNLSNKELSQNLGERLTGRIIGASEIVEIKNKVDMRKSDYKLSFENFMKDRK